MNILTKTREQEYIYEVVQNKELKLEMNVYFFILYAEGLIFSQFLIKSTCSVMAALFLGSFELLAFSPAFSQFKTGN